MQKKLVHFYTLVALLFFLVTFSFAQNASPTRIQDSIRRKEIADSIKMATEIDYQNMLQQLNIKAVRPGANGNNPKAPNAANYDEAIANPYPNLPNPLLLKNGKEVNSKKAWLTQRRGEIVEDFDREIYGRMPSKLPNINWEVLSTTYEKMEGVEVIAKKLIGHVDNSSYPSIKVDIQLNVTVPAASSKPVPIIMEFGFVFPPGMRMPMMNPNPNAKPEISWQQQVINRGWGFAIIVPVSIQADNGAGLRQGIIGLMNKGANRKPDDWGSLRAWAWGASKALDYFETDPAIDAKKVAIEGHSRYGKAALVTMAYDTRFATGFISSSGEGGAKLHRRNAGEIVENVASSGEYHWMAGNFIKYASTLTWNDLPVDAHELIGLCAPRPIFISAGEKGDGWVDVKGMFLAAVNAGPVYKLLGQKDLGSTEFPAVETGFFTGEIAFRQHTSGHTPTPNWPFFLDYAQKYFK